MAERVGLEPPLPFRVNTLSKRAPSATRPSLRRESVGERLFTEASPLRFESGESRGSYVRFNSMGEVVETATCRATRYSSETERGDLWCTVAQLRLAPTGEAGFI